MKVLYFSNTSLVLDSNGIQGTGNWSSSLVSAVLKYNNELKIFFAFHDSSIKSLCYDEVSSRITIIRIPLKFCGTKLSKLLNYWLIRDVYSNSLDFYKKIVETCQPDIIQIFGLEGPFIKLINNTHIPIIIHLQGFLPSCIFKYYNRFSFLEILFSTNLMLLLKAQTAMHEKIYLKRQIDLEGNIYSSCKNVFGRTDWDKLISKAVMPNARYYYCQEILRDGFYTNEWCYIENKKFSLVSVVRETFTKNIDIIFEVTKILEDFHKEIDFTWKIIGIKEDDLTPRIMKRRGFNSGKIKLLGRLGADGIIKELKNSSLFVLPSAIENSPNALMEAMLIGMPVLSTYAGGTGSLIDHEKSGILVTEGDPFSMAGGILQIRENKTLSINLGKTARSIAMIRNDPKHIVDTLVRAYNCIK